MFSAFCGVGALFLLYLLTFYNKGNILFTLSIWVIGGIFLLTCMFYFYERSRKYKDSLGGNYEKTKDNV